MSLLQTAIQNKDTLVLNFYTYEIKKIPIFMALLQFQKEQEEQQEQLMLFKCNYCNNPIVDKGLILCVDFVNQKYQFFDSGRCKYNHIRRERFRQKVQSRVAKRLVKCLACDNMFDPSYHIKTRKYCSRACFFKTGKKTTKLVTVHCAYCNAELQRWQSKLMQQKHGFSYCSMKCQMAYRPPRYKRNYYCDCCHKWIKHENAIESQKKKKKFLTCPNINCNGNRLKLRTKYRKKQTTMIL